MNEAKKLSDGTASTIICPNCSPMVKLIVRTNGQNGSQFLGCPNWPACDHTQAIPESWLMRLAGQKGMFDE